MTNKANPTDDDVVKMIERFISFVLDLKAIHRIIKELFLLDEDRCLIDQTAKSFFQDMFHISVKYFLLESVKITDNKATYGKENFTIDNILTTVDWPDSVKDEIYKIKPDIDCFIGHIKPARDKILAHYDKKTFLENNVLGSFPPGCDDRFVEALEEMCNILSKAATGTICGELYTGQAGDVLDLKNALEMGAAFKKLLKDSKGDDKRKLLKYLASEHDMEID